MSEERPVQNPQSDPKDLYFKSAKLRLYKVLDYLTLFLYVVIVSIAALLADLAIIYVVESSVASAVSAYPIVKQAFDWFKIGSAFLSLIGAGIHAVFSLYSQAKFEYETVREPVLGDQRE